jgi:hypothetical protein
MKVLCPDFAGLSLGGNLTVPFGHVGLERTVYGTAEDVIAKVSECTSHGSDKFVLCPISRCMGEASAASWQRDCASLYESSRLTWRRAA